MIPILCPNITLHAAARMIFLKPMTAQVTHLIKAFQCLSISLKIQANVLKSAYKSERDLVECYLSECPLSTLPLDHSTPGRLAGLLAGLQAHQSHYYLGLSALVLPSIRTTFPQYKMNCTSLLIYENYYSD